MCNPIGAFVYFNSLIYNTVRNNTISVDGLSPVGNILFNLENRKIVADFLRLSPIEPVRVFERKDSNNYLLTLTC